MNVKQFISKKEVLVENNLTNSKHIALCFDENYAMPAGILITSILANNSHINFHFHLFALSIKYEDKYKLKALDSKNTKISLYTISNDFNKLKYAAKNENFPHSSILRLIVPDLLKDETDHLLYLDCDMICNGKLDDIFKLNITNYIAACVLDIEKDRKIRSEKIGLKNNNYFNSGMLYINTQNWYNLKVAAHTLDLVGKNFYILPDQDALNVILNNKYLVADNKFNYLAMLAIDNKCDFFGKKEQNKAILFHFVGHQKPWFKFYMNDIYKNYFEKSPWAKVKIKYSHKYNPSILRILSKNFFKKKLYFISLKLKALYFLNKLRIINSFKEYNLVIK